MTSTNPTDAPPKIRWAPRLRPDLLQRLYDADAAGMQDDALCEEVGTRLYARCETFRMAARGQVRCPNCGTVFAVGREGETDCSRKACGWSTTWAEYRRTVKNVYAGPGQAADAWETYYSRYPSARTYRERILLIDQLIHSFHLLDGTGPPKKSVASKLLEGNKKSVVAFLDRLSGIEGGQQQAWRRTMSGLQDSEMLQSKKGSASDTPGRKQ